MVTEIFMPKMGQTMEEGRVIRWLKQEGDRIEKGEAVLEVETDKSTFEVEANGPGVLRKIIVQEEEMVPVATILGFIGEPDEKIPEIESKIDTVEMKPNNDTKAKSNQADVGLIKDSTVISGEVKITPRARRLAREKGLDLSKIIPSRDSGVISVEDVETYLRNLESIQTDCVQGVPGVYEIERIEKLSHPRVLIGERLRESLNTVVHTSATIEIDATNMRAQLEKLTNENSGIKVTFTSLLVYFVSRILHEVPVYNATCDGKEIKYIKQINIGIAASSPSGLVVPVICDADKKTVVQISKELTELVLKARDGQLSKDNYSYGTFTISNLGMMGIVEFTSIVNPPESAILSVGATIDRPVAEKEQIIIRPIFKVSLTYDHRIAYGIHVADFLNKLKKICECLKL